MFDLGQKKDIRKPPTLVGGAFSDRTFFSKKLVIFKKLESLPKMWTTKEKIPESGTCFENSATI